MEEAHLSLITRTESRFVKSYESCNWRALKPIKMCSRSIIGMIGVVEPNECLPSSAVSRLICNQQQHGLVVVTGDNMSCLCGEKCDCACQCLHGALSNNHVVLGNIVMTQGDCVLV